MKRKKPTKKKPKIDPELLTERDAANFLGVSMSWIQKSRHPDATSTPPFTAFGRNIRYSKTDLKAWIKDHRRSA